MGALPEIDWPRREQYACARRKVDHDRDADARTARSTTADAINYALNHWDGLARFLDDGRIDLDTNAVERAIRPVILSR